MDMEQTNRQPEFQIVGKFEIATAIHPVHHMNAPLTHDIVGDEGSLYSIHVELQGLEYRIVHILLALGGLVSTSAKRNEDSRLSLLKVNHRIGYECPVNACCGPNSS